MTQLESNLGELLVSTILNNPKDGAIILEALVDAEPILERKLNMLQHSLAVASIRVAHLHKHLDLDKEVEEQAVNASSLLDDINRKLLEIRLENVDPIIDRIEYDRILS